MSHGNGPIAGQTSASSTYAASHARHGLRRNACAVNAFLIGSASRLWRLDEGRNLDRPRFFERKAQWDRFPRSKRPLEVDQHHMITAGLERGRRVRRNVA